MMWFKFFVQLFMFSHSYSNTNDSNRVSGGTYLSPASVVLLFVSCVAAVTWRQPALMSFCLASVPLPSWVSPYWAAHHGGLLPGSGSTERRVCGRHQESVSSSMVYEGPVGTVWTHSVNTTLHFGNLHFQSEALDEAEFFWTVLF